MKLPEYVKPYPKVIVWMLPRFNGNSLYPLVLLKPDIYEDLTSDSPRPKNVATFAHELHHRERQQTAGRLRWILHYIVSREYRFKEELSAYKITMMVRKFYGEDFDTDQCARALSGSTYLWSTSYEKAHKSLNIAWKEAKPTNPSLLFTFE